MTAKDYLQEIQVLDVKFEQKKQEYMNLRELNTGVRAVDYSKVRTQNTERSAGFTKHSDKVLDMFYELQEECVDFNLMRHKRIEEIQMMKKVEYMDILFKRFVEYKSMECIAKEMDYTYKYASKLLNLALKAFEKQHADKIEEYRMSCITKAS